MSVVKDVGIFIIHGRVVKCMLQGTGLLGQSWSRQWLLIFIVEVSASLTDGSFYFSKLDFVIVNYKTIHWAKYI